MAVVWLNGELLPEISAHVPALDRGVLWGYGLFETMRAYGGDVWAFGDHYGRLRQGAEVLEIAAPPDGELHTAVAEVIDANGLADAGVRITITRGTGPPDPSEDATGLPNVLVTAWPLRDYTDLYDRGAALVTLPGGGRPLAGIKTTSYAVSIAGRILAQRAGADDALFTSDDRVLEATGSNVFVVKGPRLTTPPLEDAILPGVTRKHILQVAAHIGFETTEAPVALNELFDADEVVLTSSLREAYPARSVDGREVNRGDAAERLREAYHTAAVSA